MKMQRELFKRVGPFGFPVAARQPRPAGAAPAGEAAPAPNGYLSSLLPREQRAQLRRINVRLTELALQQCSADPGAANQILWDTLICEAVAAFAARGVDAGRLVELARNFDVVFPWSLAYGNVRTTMNARFIRLPLAVAFPRTVDEVVQWVKTAREGGFSVSIRSGNNCYESFAIDNEIVIDLTYLALPRRRKAEEQFRVDRKAGVVHCSPGIRLGVLYTELAKHHLTVAAGQCAPVCVGGLVGTGGVGFATRGFGYACDQLTEVEYVLADGSVVVANADNEHADLYRATKGAGSAGLGVMTRLTLRTIATRPILLYTVSFAREDGLIDAEDIASVLEQWQNLAEAAPDVMSSIGYVSDASLSLPSPTFFVNGEFRVEKARGIDDEKAIEDAKTALTDTLRRHWLDRIPPRPDKAPISSGIDIEVLDTVEAATAVAAEVPMPVFNHWKLKSNFVFRTVTAAELKPVAEFFLTHAASDDPSSTMAVLNILLLGGQANRIDPESAVVPAREGSVMWVQSGALWNDQSLEPQCLAFVDSLYSVLKPALEPGPDSGTGQYGVPDLQLGSQWADPPDFRYLKAFWSGPTHDFVPFLLQVKQRYDPGDLFGFAQSIPVAPDPLALIT